MQSHSEDCIKKAKTQLGGFPVFIKPARPGNKCVHSYSVASNPEEMRAWIKVLKLRLFAVFCIYLAYLNSNCYITSKSQKLNLEMVLNFAASFN